MSAGKHTQGPLTAATRMVFGRIFHVVKGASESEAVAITGIVGEGGEREERSIADANLFSAAPDLLEKLENVLPILDDAHQDAVRRGHSDPDWQRVAESFGLQCDAARAAIAKAKGEA